MRGYYFGMTDREREINTERWLDKVSESVFMQARGRVLVLFPPYGSIDALAKQKSKIKRD